MFVFLVVIIVMFILQYVSLKLSTRDNREKMFGAKIDTILTWPDQSISEQILTI